MKKTHGLMATACMLSSGLLLDTTMTAEAQVYSVPRPALPSMATTGPSTPGLLPNALRQHNQTPSGEIIRPIAPSSSHKLTGSASVTSNSKSSSRVGVTTTAYQDGGVQQATPSPVQQQLEELYRRDGRPMPNMNFQQTHIGAGNTSTHFGTPVPGATTARPAPISRPNTAIQPASRPSLLGRLNPFRAKPATTPTPGSRQTPRPIQNVGGQQPRVQPNSGLPQPNAVVQPNGVTQPNQLPQQFARPAQPIAITPAPAAVANEAAKSFSSSGLADTLPPVPGEEAAANAVESATNAIGKGTNAIGKGAAAVDDALNNVFNDNDPNAATPEAKEVEAPATIPSSEPALKTEAKTEEKAEENPFSGLSLDAPSDSLPTPPALTNEESAPANKPASNAVNKPAENAEEEAPLELPPLDSATTEEAPLTLPPEPAAATTVEIPQETEVQIEAKMKQIAERGELRGLKGFCPVALRDERDLKNAMPEHTTTFKGRTYYFSTAEAKAVFEEHPEQYAPAAGGNDVVLQKSKVTKEGSLDFAIWYKDRLYLFTSQKTLEQFVATPKEFATHE